MSLFEELLIKLKTQEIKSFKNWLYITTKNHCLMQLRKEKASAKVFKKIAEETCSGFVENSSGFVENMNNPHLLSEQNEVFSIDKLHEVIKALKKEQGECIDLFYLQNKSYKEVAELTGYSMKDVKSNIQNGKRMLKKMLNQDYERE